MQFNITFSLLSPIQSIATGKIAHNIHMVWIDTKDFYHRNLFSKYDIELMHIHEWLNYLFHEIR